MTARIAAAGDLGIDYSGARPSPAGTFKAGGRFILRYSAGAGNHDSGSAWKLCGTGEIAAAVKAGLDFIANSEWTTGRVTQGATAGKADGAADLVFWKSRGLAKGATIYVSWDAAPVKAKWPATDAYYKAYGAALGGYYNAGAYAGTPYLKHALAAKVITHGWRPNAGSWSSDGLPYQPNTSTAAKRATLLKLAMAATPAAIWQTGNYWWAKGADENLLLRPAGSHLQALAAAKPVVKPPAKPPAKPVPPYYPVVTTVAHGVSSPNGAWAIFPTNDGKVDVRHNGVHSHYL